MVGRLDPAKLNSSNSSGLDMRIYDFLLHDWACLDLQHAPMACYHSLLVVHDNKLVLFGGELRHD